MKNLVSNLNSICLAALLLVGCTVDPYEDVKSNERSIEKFMIDGQIGVLTVKSRTESQVDAEIFVKSGTSLSNVVPSIQTSYRASVSPASGEPVTFSSDSTATFTVKAESGVSKVWNIKVKPYDYDLEGVWKVEKIYYYYHVAPDQSWGWTGTKELNWYMTGAHFASDDSFEFRLESATADGKIQGLFIHDLGGDGKAPTFVYDAAEPHYDMNYKFDKIPAASGSWIRDLASNTISFNPGTEGETTSMPIELSGDRTELVIPFDPGPADFPGGNDWNRGEIQYSTKFWYYLKKVQ